MSDVEIDAYNIEAKYLDKILEFVENDLDEKLVNFLDVQNNKNTHDLLNSIIVLLGKLQRSSRINKKFHVDINKDLIKIGKGIEQENFESSDILKLVNKINKKVSDVHFFTKPSMGETEMKVEGPDED